MTSDRSSSIIVFPSLVVMASLAAMALLTGCRPDEASNFGVERMAGKVLQSGERVKFADLPAKRVILNAYSPTCVPCIKELPALHVLQAAAAEKGYPLFMVVDTSRPEMQLDEVPPGMTAHQALEARLQEDIRKYNIKIPLVLMDADSYRVGQESLVTATPETMLLRTKPLILEYNFIGPISELEGEALLLDSRFQFILKKIQG